MSKINGFITNLGKYNEGYLIGEWVGFPLDLEELNEVLKRIGCAYTDEEGRTHNHQYEEYFFTDWDIDIHYIGWSDEFINIDEINELAEQVEALEEWEFKKLEAIIEAECFTLDEALDNLDSYGIYEGMSLLDVAYELVEDCYFTKDTPDFFTRYFDFEAFARDLGFDGYTETEHGVIYGC